MGCRFHQESSLCYSRIQHRSVPCTHGHHVIHVPTKDRQHGGANGFQRTEVFQSLAGRDTLPLSAFGQSVYRSPDLPYPDTPDVQVAQHKSSSALDCYHFVCIGLRVS